MSESKINISLSDLEGFLRQQKELVVNNILSQKGVYNNSTTEGSYEPLDINEDAMKKIAMETRYPEEFNTLKRYLPKED